MARATMASLIERLRLNTDASVNDETVNGVAYWTDDQLEEILDNYQKPLVDVLLTPKGTWNGSALEFKRYYLPTELPIEDSPEIRNHAGTLLTDGVEYTYYPNRDMVEFVSNQYGRSVYLRGVAYDIDAASADVWNAKAGLRAELIKWKAGEHTLDEDKEYQHCIQMAQRYSRKAGFKTVKLIRTGYVYG